MLAALVLGAVGLVRHDDSTPIILLCALTLGSLAGLEFAIREHFGGYKPHATVLAAGVALVPLAVLFFAHASRFLLPPVALAVFGVAFWALRGLYKRRAGGLGYR